jgi:hypothetical protein
MGSIPCMSKTCIKRLWCSGLRKTAWLLPLPPLLRISEDTHYGLLVHGMRLVECVNFLEAGSKVSKRRGRCIPNLLIILFHKPTYGDRETCSLKHRHQLFLMPLIFPGCQNPLLSLIQHSTSLPTDADFINSEQPTGYRETWLQFSSSRKMLHHLRSQYHLRSQ